MADEQLVKDVERAESVPKVEREAYAESAAADAADHLSEERTPGVETGEAAKVEDIAVKLNPDFPVEGTQTVSVASFPEIKLYEGKAVKVSPAHAAALENAGIAVRNS